MAKKVAVIKDIHLINYYNKINKVKVKPTKDPSGDMKITTYLAIGTELSYTQCWFKKGICTMVMFDLEDIYNAYGTRLGGLQEVVSRFCEKYTYYEDRGNAVVAIDAERFMDDEKYVSKLFAAFYVFTKNVNEFFGTDEENVFDDENTIAFYREYVERLRKKHKTLSILSLILFVASIVAAIMVTPALGVLGALVSVIGALYHFVRAKYFSHEFFRVRMR